MIDRIKQLYLQDRMLVLMLLFVILLFFILIPFVIIPQIQLLLQARGDIKEGKERLVRLEEKLSKLEQIETSSLAQQFALSSLALPSSKDIGALLVTLDILSQKHGVVLSDFSASIGMLDTPESSVEPGAPAPTLTMTIALRGELEGIKSFLNAISQSLPIVSIKNINFSKNGVAVSLVFYYKPFITSLPPVDSDLPNLAQFTDTIASLSARSSAVVSGPQPAFEEQAAPSKPQIFTRPDPFF